MDHHRLKAVRLLLIEQDQKAQAARYWRNAPGQCAELADQYSRGADELIQEIMDIHAAMDELEPVEKDLLRAYYIEGRAWGEVCRLVGYETAQAHRIKARALDKLSRPP